MIVFSSRILSSAPIVLSCCIFFGLQQASSALLLLVPPTGILPSRQGLAHRPGGNSLSAAGSEDSVRCSDDDSVPADDDDSSSTGLLHRALASRVAALEKGIGRRYVCRTQIGFLNVHDAPGDPFDTENIVGQLVDGQIVASTGAPEGAWIQHDGGGWSISVYEGFVWLEELQE